MDRHAAAGHPIQQPRTMAITAMIAAVRPTAARLTAAAAAAAAMGAAAAVAAAVINP